MESLTISLISIVLITIVARLIANFFDISALIYMPYIIWLVALCLFNIILEKVHVNKFMEDIK